MVRSWSWQVCAQAFALLLAAGGSAEEATARRPVDPAVPPGEQPGPRPYEVLWSGARNEPPPQVTFADLTGWTLEVRGTADVSLRASVEQHVWADRVAKFSYAGGEDAGAGVQVDQTTGKAVAGGTTPVGTTAWIRPPQPLPIAGEFDAAKLWVYGGHYRTTDGIDSSPPLVQIVLRDAAGKPVRISLGRVSTGNWSIEQGVIDPAERARVQFPLSFEAMEVADCNLPGATCMYFESLTFYRSPRAPERYAKETAVPGFPTTADGLLPTPPVGLTTRLESVADGAVFTSTSAAGELRYEVRPADGVLHGVTARWQGGKAFRPLAGGGLRLPATTVAGQLRSAALEGDAYVARWGQDGTAGAVQWQATYRLRGRTLVLDLQCLGGAAEGVDVGEMSGLDAPRGIFVPYLLLNRQSHIYANGPWVGCAEGVFVSVWPDVYHSDFANIDHRGGEPTGDRLRLLGGTEYWPLTNGRRNDLRERLLVTVSPEFRDTLPNPPNPPSPNRAELAPYLFALPYWPSLNYFRTLKRHGLDQVIACAFCWYVQGYDKAGLIGSSACRWRPRPEIGMERLQEYRRGIKELGYRFGTYSFLPCVSPVSEYWDETALCLRPDGSLARGWWYGEWALKFAAMLPIVQDLGRKVQQYYPADLTYLDINTVIGPAAHDQEAGVAGAGTARATVVGNLACIRDARNGQHAVMGEGYFRWLYAGVSDADYATMVRPDTYASTSEMPLLPDFDLLKIHPLEHGMMMGVYPQLFLSTADSRELLQESGGGLPPLGFYKVLAATLAYGHMAMVGYDYDPPLARVMHLYALLQGVQSEYLTDTVASIEYHDGRGFVSTSQALLGNTLRMGRIHVSYMRGLQVYVNYSAEHSWTVRTAAGEHELPPYGWVIHKPGAILAFSALRDQQRVDLVDCPTYLYLNTGDAERQHGPLRVRGAALVRKPLGGEPCRVIPCGNLGTWESFAPEGYPADMKDRRLTGTPADRGCGLLRLDTQQLLGKAPSAVRVTARDAAGAAVATGNLETDGPSLSLPVRSGCVDFEVQ